MDENLPDNLAPRFVSSPPIPIQIQTLASHRSRLKFQASKANSTMRFPRALARFQHLLSLGAILSALTLARPIAGTADQVDGKGWGPPDVNQLRRCKTQPFSGVDGDRTGRRGLEPGPGALGLGRCGQSCPGPPVVPGKMWLF